MLLIDGVKYEEWTPQSEEEFEKSVSNHASEIFGLNSEYFNLKHRLVSKSGTGSIPDGYVISLANTPQLHIVELELASHSLQHIVTQVVNIISGIENPATQQRICNTIEDEINQHEVLSIRLARAIKPVSAHRFLSDCFSKSPPPTNVLIDKNLLALEEALSRVSYPHKIIEFQTFTREGVGLAVHAHLFEPLEKYAEERPKPPIPDSVEIPIRAAYFMKFHLFVIPKDKRSFFPGYKQHFSLLTDLGEIETWVTSKSQTYPEGTYIQGNLAEWYRKHPSINVGDKVRVTAIEPMKKYRLEILK